MTSIKGAIKALCKFQTYFSFAFQAAFQAANLQDEEHLAGAQLLQLRETLAVLENENRLLQEANSSLETAMKKFSALPILGDRMRCSIFEVIDVIKEIKGLHANVLLAADNGNEGQDSVERLERAKQAYGELIEEMSEDDGLVMAEFITGSELYCNLESKLRELQSEQAVSAGNKSLMLQLRRGLQPFSDNNSGSLSSLRLLHNAQQTFTINNITEETKEGLLERLSSRKQLLENSKEVLLKCQQAIESSERLELVEEGTAENQQAPAHIQQTKTRLSEQPREPSEIATTQPAAAKKKTRNNSMFNREQLLNVQEGEPDRSTTKLRLKVLKPNQNLVNVHPSPLDNTTEVTRIAEAHRLLSSENLGAESSGNFEPSFYKNLTMQMMQDTLHSELINATLHSNQGDGEMTNMINMRSIEECTVSVADQENLPVN